MSSLNFFIITLFIIFLSACVGTGQKMPLIFAQSQVVGIEVSGSATDQGGKFVLGYEDSNIAVIPVITENNKLITATRCDEIVAKTSVCGKEDTFSVFGQFEVGVTSEKEVSNPNIVLGKFFATGFAAQTISKGFADQMKNKSSANTQSSQ